MVVFGGGAGKHDLRRAETDYLTSIASGFPSNSERISLDSKYTLAGIYVRKKSDAYVDLDHLENPSVPDICGVYINDADTEQTKAVGVGCLVLGDDEDNNYYVTYNYDYRSHSGFQIYGFCDTVQPIRYIVRITATKYESPFTRGNVFILEGGKNPTEFKQFWYTTDLVDDNYIYKTTNSNGEEEPITFKFMNLDETVDITKPDIVLKPKGFSRKYIFDKIGYEDQGHFNVGVCNWLSPITNLGE